MLRKLLLGTVTSVLMASISISCKSGNEIQFNKEITIKEKIEVIDGDTIKILKSPSERITLRFLGIDTPETFKGDNQVAMYENFYAQKAKQFVSEIVKKAIINVIFLKKDKYGRYVARLFYSINGQKYDLQKTLLEHGLARVKYIEIKEKRNPYFVENEDLITYFLELKEIENKAKAMQINI
ncbi:UNVERIFIED_CONTAM: thermonuclease family protein [Campylobacter lari]